VSGRVLHLNANLLNLGAFGGAWRAPESDPAAFADLRHYVGAARIAEDAGFAAVFLPDRPEFQEELRHRPVQALESTVLLGAIAASTTRIGLIGTASTTYNSPYNLARRFATLDRVSDGRAGWNIVTTGGDRAGRNFGGQPDLDHDGRYRRAEEFVDVVLKLWRSWDDDALVGDKDAARFVDPSRIHPPAHAGEHFAVAGALNIPRSAQGHPILVQAGASPAGTAFAARYADVIFSAAQTPEESREHRDRLRRLVTGAGRDPDQVILLPGLTTVIGGTEAEARARADELASLVPEQYAIERLAGTLGVDPELLDLDAQLPFDRLPPLEHAPAPRTFFALVTSLAARERMTVRDLLRRFGGGAGHRILVGAPEQIAADLEHWLHEGAADGFNLIPDVIPSGLAAFADHVVPELRRRGVLRSPDEAGPTLRDRYGLPFPARSEQTPDRSEEEVNA
jgi:FMN-dependent oxidoreductase (nitrilotriacetate monooxygenase family)